MSIVTKQERRAQSAMRAITGLGGLLGIAIAMAATSGLSPDHAAAALARFVPTFLG